MQDGQPFGFIILNRRTNVHTRILTIHVNCNKFKPRDFPGPNINRLMPIAIKIEWWTLMSYNL